MSAQRPALDKSIWGASAVRLRTLARQWLGPLTLSRAAQRLRAVIDQLQPDLVHAMRIPYEGMLAAVAVGARSETRPCALLSLY